MAVKIRQRQPLVIDLQNQAVGLAFRTAGLQISFRYWKLLSALRHLP